MLSRIASMFLLLMTIGFFTFHYWWKSTQAPQFVDTINPTPDSQELIAHNEFLLLMDVGDEVRLNEVLGEFNLEVLTPLGEWVHVIRREANKIQNFVPLSSKLADEDRAFASRLEAHDAVHTAQLNFLQNADASIGCVESERDAVSDATIVPSDPLFKHQWYLSKKMGIDLPGAWAKTTGSDATVIAIVDRNFDFTEEDLDRERCSSRKYYYENVLDYFPQQFLYTKAANEKHGSQVLSVVAPCTDNAVGLSGIDWHAQVFAVDTLDNATFSARIFGVSWASGLDVCSKGIAGCPENSAFQKNMHRANVINTSFGFAGNFLRNPPYGPVLDIIGRINRQGQIIVASAGNEGSIADRRLPGAAGGVISVGSSNIHQQSSNFSNVGHSVDVVAPGENIFGLSKGKPISLNGTSFSAPIVAGIVALMLSVNPLLSWKQIEYILKVTATPLSCSDYCPHNFSNLSVEDCRAYCCVGEENHCASGIVNAARAVAMAAEGFPDVALVDVDDYFVPLSEDNNHSAKVIIKNWGLKSGIMRLHKTDRHLNMIPPELRVGPINEYGIPGTAVATVFYDKKPEKELMLSLLIEAANVDQPHVFHDQIEATFSIVPDPSTPTTPKVHR